MVDLTAFQIATLSAVLLYSVFDPLRDANVKRLCGWWKWHIFKWLSTYPVLGVLVYFAFPIFWQFSAICAGSWIVWKFSLRYIAGVKWESIWVKLIKMILGIKKWNM